jgi:hypothetical protein
LKILDSFIINYFFGEALNAGDFSAGLLSLVKKQVFVQPQII